VITIAAGEELRLVVADDGVGIGDANATGLGLKNLRQRAERLGGSVELGTSREGGTRLTWHVPLSRVEAGAGPAA
jgi:signal transduction histidine kinase